MVVLLWFLGITSPLLFIDLVLEVEYMDCSAVVLGSYVVVALLVLLLLLLLLKVLRAVKPSD